MIDQPMAVICTICRHDITTPDDLADLTVVDTFTGERSVNLAHGECARKTDPDGVKWSFAKEAPKHG